jgi:hypothetical protein
LLTFTALAPADRIIFAPNALKVLNRTARLEYLYEPSRPDNSRGYLAVGLSTEIEAELVFERLEGRPLISTFNASFQYLIPIVDTSPGLAFGVQDAMDRSAEGRMYYIAFTQRFGLDGKFNSSAPLEISGGFGFGRRSGVFIGASIPFTYQFRFLAEHDLRKVSAGFELRPFNGAALRVLFHEGQTQLGARYTFKF